MNNSWQGINKCAVIGLTPWADDGSFLRRASNVHPVQCMLLLLRLRGDISWHVSGDPTRSSIQLGAGVERKVGVVDWRENPEHTYYQLPTYLGTLVALGMMMMIMVQGIHVTRHGAMRAEKTF
jgi:hypothetical protein